MTNQVSRPKVSSRLDWMETTEFEMTTAGGSAWRQNGESKRAKITRGDKEGIGGAERDRTAGLLVANEALSQLSYSPTTSLSYQRAPFWERSRRYDGLDRDYDSGTR